MTVAPQNSTAAATSTADETPQAASDKLALTPSMRSHHIWMLWIAGIVVLFAAILEVSPDREHIFIRGLPQWTLPGSCPSREILHVNCPGCGLTRSIVFLAHNNWRASWQMHHIGWLMAFAIVGQIPYRILCLRRRRMVLGSTFPKIIAYTLIGLLFSNWLINLL